MRALLAAAGTLRMLVSDEEMRDRCRQVSRHFDGSHSAADAAKAIETTFEVLS